MTKEEEQKVKDELAIRTRALGLREAGQIDEARKLEMSIPLPPWMADVLKLAYGGQNLLKSGWNLSEVEATYGKDWFNE
jgi:hypothetical protein